MIIEKCRDIKLKKNKRKSNKQKKEKKKKEQTFKQINYLTIHSSLSPIRRGFASGFVNYKKMCTRLAVASDTVYQFGGSLRVLRLLPPLKLVAMI
jgi:hypothetical protein